MGDPIFPDKPVIPAPPEHPHEKHHAAGNDWVVVHRGGEGSKAHVEALERKLIKAHINARVEHDDDHKVVLEVPRDEQDAALAVLGDGNTHGAGEVAHQTHEQKLEAGEQSQLHGAFAATQSKTLLVVLAIAVFLFLGFWFLSYFHLLG
jgi:hypothetical protein